MTILKAEQNRLNKRQVLLKVALDEFSKKPYEQASLNMILKKAGVTKGAFYYSFKDKWDLYEQLLQEIVQRKMDYFATALNGEPLIQPDNQNLFDFLKSMIIIALGFIQKYPKYEAFNRKFLSESETFRNALLQGNSLDISDYLEPMIDRAFDNGDIDECYTPYFVKKLVFYLMVHYMDVFGVDESNEDMCKNLEMLFILMNRGFEKR